MRFIKKRLKRFLPDVIFLKLMYRKVMRKKLNLKDPKTFNEKLQWLKLYDRKPEYTTMVDKAAVKNYVADKIGPEYIIPTLGVWDRFDDIDFDSLPDQFVLKCTHDSGGLVICRDKNTLDRAAAKEKIEKSLARNYYLHAREWPYKNVKPRILAESYLEEESGDLRDYKFFCFNGEPKCALVCAQRYTGDGVRMSFYDPQWNQMSFHWRYPPIETEVERPQELEKMLSFAKILSENIPFVRVDFYEVKGQVYFGELTFFPASGTAKFDSDEIMGTWITLPEKLNPRG